MNALLTINYNNALAENSRASMEAACGRWRCDFIEYTGGGKNHPVHSPAAMKTLAFKELAPQHERLLILDADTVIRSDTPSPFAEFNSNHFYAVENGGPRFGDNSGIQHSEQHEWNKVEQFLTSNVHWKAALRPMPPWRKCIPYFNTGMMLACRHLHEGVFETAERLCRHDFSSGWHEQTPLNMVMAWRACADRMRPLVFTALDETWNYIHPELCLGPDWRQMQKYIYHFAGTPNRHLIIPEVKWQAA